MAPFHGFGPGEPEPRLRNQPDELDDINVLVVAKRVKFYEVWVERIWSRSD
jgi:hypothetical protein